MVDSENVMRLDRPGRALFIPKFNISAYNRLFTSLFDLLKIKDVNGTGIYGRKTVE